VAVETPVVVQSQRRSNPLCTDPRERGAGVSGCSSPTAVLLLFISKVEI